MSENLYAKMSNDEIRALNERQRAEGKLEIPLHSETVVSPPVRVEIGRSDIRPVAECLCCGHIVALAVWKEAPFNEVTHGVCEPCRDAAEPLRGHCSEERGCWCQRLETER